MTKSNIWFALGADGEMYCLCDCGDMDAAEESAKDLGIEAVWLVDQQGAEQWQARLNQNLSPIPRDEVSMTDEQFDDALDDATHAVLQAFGLNAGIGMGLAFKINDALTNVMRDYVDEVPS